MSQLIGTVLTLAYLALFLFFISKMKFFRIGSIPVRWFQGAFVLKVLSGFLLYLIYTYHYTDRSTADIWKYYDDAMVMYSALREHPMDYLQMLIGWGADNRERFTAYYDLMSHWDKPYTQGVANDTHTIIRFNAFVRLFSLGHYNVHSVVVNFLGLIGLTGIFHFLRMMDAKKERWFFAGIFLMPGVLFWTSGVLKEPLLLLGLGLFLHAIMRLSMEGLSALRLLLLTLSLLMLLSVKSYVLMAILPGLFVWWAVRRFPRIHPIGLMMVLVVLGAIGLGVFRNSGPVSGMMERLSTKQHEFYRLAQGGTYVRIASGDTLYIKAADFDLIRFQADRDSAMLTATVSAVGWRDANMPDAARTTLYSGTEFYVILDYGKTGSTIDIPRLDGSVSSIFKAVPMALVNALFRPFPWHVDSPFMLLSAVENLLIGLLFFLALMGMLRGAPSFLHPVFLLSISFALLILILTGLVTPVVGAIVRYKVPALPFLVCALLVLIDTAAIEAFLFRRFPALKRYF